MKLIKLLLLISALLGLCACEPGSAPGTPGSKPSVVATTTMIADMVRQIGGDEIALTALMGPGVDARPLGGAGS